MENENLKRRLKYCLRWIPDRMYIQMYYFGKQHHFAKISKPVLFSEKIQWIKLNRKCPDYPVMVDKCEAKNYVAQRIGGQYIIPTLGVYKSFDEIDFDRLPNQFVIKCTHDSAGLVIVPDKSRLDIPRARKIITDALSQNFFYMTREWAYKNVEPRIIVEQYLENDSSEGLHDYKIWCFNGRAEYIQYISGRTGSSTREAFYDRSWHKQTFSYHNPLMKEEVPRPERLQELLEVAETLSAGHDFLRVDFYVLTNGDLKFGELTLYPMGGTEVWHPASMDRVMGDKLRLTK